MAIRDGVRRSPWRWRFVGLALLAAAVWLLPAAIAVSPLKQTLVEQALPALPGRVTVGALSLGWFSPVIARNVTWRDEHGNELVHLAAVRLERTVAQLLVNRSDVGTIHLESPALTLELRDAGSNWEDALGPLLAQPTSQAPGQLALTVENGTARVADVAAGVTWELNDIQGSLALPAATDEVAHASLAAKIAEDSVRRREMQIEFQWQAPGNEPQPNDPGGALKVQCTGWPLAMLRPIVRRSLPNADLGGEVALDGEYEFNADHSQQRIKLKQLDGALVSLAAPTLFGTDTPGTSQLQASGEMELRGGRAHIAQLQVTADFASISAVGHTDLAAWSGASWASLWNALIQDDFEMQGEVDLARLSVTLPQTLRIRSDTRITSGRIAVSASSQQSRGKRRWTASLHATQLAAEQQGREVVWDEPLTLELAAQQTATGAVIERLTCKSNFLTALARGTLEQGEFTADGDLARLQAELNRFVTLDGVRLAGQLAADGQWRRAADTSWRAQAQAVVREFQLQAPGLRAWSEPQFTLDASATCRTQGAAIAALDQAELRFTSAQDQLAARLLTPISVSQATTAWPLAISGRGELANWLPRVQAWLPTWVEQAAGAAALEGEIHAAADHLDIRTLKLDIARLRLVAAGLQINEPEVHVVGDGRWDVVKSQWTTQSAALSASAVAARVDQLTVIPQQSGAALAGEIGFRGDVAKLATWFPVSATSSLRWSGNATGRVKFAHQNETTVAQWTCEGERWALARPSSLAVPTPPLAPASAATAGTFVEVWSDPKMTWTGHGELDHARGAVQLKQCTVTSKTFGLTASGSLVGLSASPAIDVRGEVTYNLPAIAALLDSYLASDVPRVAPTPGLFGPMGTTATRPQPAPTIKLAGEERREFMIRGPLPSLSHVATTDTRQPALLKWSWPDELQAAGGFGWQAAEIYGLGVGPVDLAGKLEQGIGTIAPLDVRIAEGRLQAWPRIVLANDPVVFQLAKGTQLEKVQITPAMCHAWLKYVAPLLADATRAEGNFSASTEGLTLPVFAPHAGAGKGVLTVHGARVGPGPVAESYILLAQQIRSLAAGVPLDPTRRPDAIEWITMPQQAVEVQLAEGRVYHRGLTLQINDTRVVTSGSVGFDQTLGLLVEVPLQDEWVAKSRVLSAMRGQTLRIPVTGTVKQPKLDDRVLGQIVGSAASGLIEQKLNESLDKLLRPRK